MPRRKLTLIIVASAFGLLMVFGLVSSAVFANTATKKWNDKAYNDVLEEFKKNFPGRNPETRTTAAMLKQIAEARMWDMAQMSDSTYGPPASLRNQGIANICGILGIIGMLGILICFIISWQARKKSAAGAEKEPEYSEILQDSQNEADANKSGARGALRSRFRGVVVTCR